MSFNLGYVRRHIREESTTVRDLLEKELGKKEKARKSQVKGSMENDASVKGGILRMTWYSWTRVVCVWTDRELFSLLVRDETI